MSNFAVVFIGSTLFALQQLSGINAVFYFSSTVFKSFGVPSDRANICIGVANFLGTLALTGSASSSAMRLCWYMPYFFSSFRVNCCNDTDG